MRAKLFVIFWGATVAATLLVGAIWSTAGRVTSSGRGAADVIVTGLAGIGLAVCLFVAGRIVIVMGRVQRRHRATRS